MTESYPPLPLDEQIRKPKPLPGWWTHFSVDLPIGPGYPQPPGKNYRYWTWYYKPPGWVPGAACIKGAKLGPRQQETLQRMKAEPDRWFTLPEIRQWWNGDGSIYQSLATMVRHDFLLAAPADNWNVPHARGRLPHYWKYKFCEESEWA